MKFHKLAIVGCMLLLSSLAFPAHKPEHKPNRKDPAFVHGYDDGYRIGAQDSALLSPTYNQATGPIYEEATNGYTPSYGDLQTYKRRFRRGYIAGYKAGWDFNAGQYIPHF